MTPYIVSLTLDKGAGGIASSLLLYSKALAQKNYTHKVILPAGSPIIESLQQQEKTEVIPLPGTIIKAMLITRLLFSAQLKKLFSNATAILLHNSKLIRYQLWPDKSFVICHSGKMRNLEKARNIIFLTSSAQHRFQSEFPQQQQAINQQIVPHGFEILQDNIAKTTSKDATRIVAAGRFVEKKGFGELIAAAERLAQEQVSFSLNIYGDGLLKGQLQEQASATKNISIMPWTNNLSGVFKNADVFCLPSLVEPFGLVLGEAMLTGLPVVASDTDGPLEIIGQDNPESRGGYIYKRGNTDQLTLLLMRLCKQPDLRERVGMNARKNIEDNFSLQNMAIKLEQAILSIRPT